jgi:anaerobic ribonucleoside-triphosphate reductase activating protein
MDKKTELRLAGMLDNSLTNGVGIRKVYFSQGCKHHCKGCFSPHTWDFVSGKIFKVEELFEKLVEEKDYLNGVTFSGGDPLEQAEGFANFAKKIKTLKLNIWC